MGDQDIRASRALLTAALGGLLGVTACSTPSSPSVAPVVEDTGALVDASAPKDTAVDVATGDASDASAEATVDAVAEVSDVGPDAAPDAVDPCGDTGSDAGVILSSHEDPTMTLEIFTKMCDERGGKLEIHSHCGGQNSCKGMSYDSGTKVFTEHSCKAVNTCTGFSCVLPC